MSRSPKRKGETEIEVEIEEETEEAQKEVQDVTTKREETDPNVEVEEDLTSKVQKKGMLEAHDHEEIDENKPWC